MAGKFCLYHARSVPVGVDVEIMGHDPPVPMGFARTPNVVSWTIALVCSSRATAPTSPLGRLTDKDDKLVRGYGNRVPVHNIGGVIAHVFRNSRTVHMSRSVSAIWAVSILFYAFHCCL